MQSDDSELRESPFGRRQLLGSLGAGLAAVPTAGCLSSLPTMGQQIRYADVEVPTSDDPGYREWTPARRTGDERGDVLRVDYLAPREVYADDTFVTGIHDVIVNVLVARLDYLGVGYRNYDELFALSDAVVGRGSFGAAQVRETVLETAYEATGKYEEYDLFERPGAGRAVAVRDGTVVYSGADRAREAIEAVIDANEGRTERLHEADDGFATISRDLGAMPAMSFWPAGGGMADDLLEAYDPQWSVNCSTRDDEYVYEVNHVRLESEVDVPERHLKDHLEEVNEWARAHTAEVTVDGGLVEIAVKWTREEALEWTGGQERSTPPQITWETAVEADGDAVRIEHLAGDSVDASDLTLIVPGQDVATPGPQFGDRFDTVEPGDELTVDVSDSPADAVLNLVYEPNESQVLVLERQQLE